MRCIAIYVILKCDYRCDALIVGDYITSVNGIRTCRLKHEEIVNLLKNAGNKVILEIEYEIPVTSEFLSNYTIFLTSISYLNVCHLFS